MTKSRSLFLNLTLFALFIFVSAGSAFAQTLGYNHSYFITDSGQIHTVRSYTPAEGFIPLFSPNGFFILPEMIDVKQSSYFTDTDGTLYTVDRDGYLYSYNYESEIDSRMRHEGGSFFITRDRSLRIVLTNGVIKTIVEDDYELDSNIKVVGGNYLITRKNTVYIINPIAGTITKTGVEIDKRDVEVQGDNYLVTKEGTLYSFAINVDGSVKIRSTSNRIFKNIKRKGGNFFFDSRNQIHTIAANGEFNNGSRSVGTDVRRSEVPLKFGANYFVYADNSFFIVDELGIVRMIDTFNDVILLTTK
jgi:hypothetical protein